MGKMKKYLSYFVTGVAGFLTAISVLSLFYNMSSIWWIKSLNFPRIQVLAVSFVTLSAALLFMNKRSVRNMLVLTGLVASVVINASFIITYTPIVGKQVSSLEKDKVDSADRISLLIANVYMKNKKSDAFIDVVLKKSPDMVLVMETNAWWQKALLPLKATYPHHIEYPLENTYGMMLYSRYELQKPQIKFLEHQGVPSIHTEVQLLNGRRFAFHGMHPVPPLPSKYPDNIGEDAGELNKVGEMVAKESLPVVVAGDLNDVAWSNTNRVFQEKSRLNDVRTGRRFYGTFSAHSVIMRWPLDHVFVTEDFKLVQLEKMDNFGSDHFPIYVQLALEP